MTPRKSIILCLVLGLAGVVLAAAGPARAARKDAEEHGDPARGAAVARVCVRCHDPARGRPRDGIPHLQGQKEYYLRRQIRAFTADAFGDTRPVDNTRRHDRLMSRQAEPLTDRNTLDVAAYLSAQPCVPSRQRISAAGAVPPDPARLRLCARCHGPEGHSRNLQIPSLAGQNERYLVAQLMSFRARANHQTVPGAPRDRDHWLATRQTKDLTDDEIASLSAYYAREVCW